MSKFTVQYFNGEKPVKPYSFYVLCKGKNSGKPMPLSCPNCFVFTCSSQADADYYFTVCFAMWKAKILHPHLCGSVIEFIRIDDFKELLQAALGSVRSQNDAFTSTVEKVKLIEQKEDAIKQQLALLGQLKISMLRQFIK